jgi:hypothetical protein
MNNDKQKKDSGEDVKIYLTPDSTLQTPEEHRHDESVDPRKDNTIGVSNDDLRETDVDRMRDDLDGARGNGNANGS